MQLPQAAQPEDVGLSSAGLDAVDAGLQALVDKGELAGAVTLVARHGKVARRRRLGLDNIERKKAFTEDTIFRVYSMTKLVTAVAMMILYDQGLWKPDDPTAKFLPSFANATVFDGLGDGGGAKRIPADHQPTIRELMTRTAGHTYGDVSTELGKLYHAAGVWNAGSLAEFAERVGRMPLAYQPG
jgi:CubicO group peptidase (beta-lactamase class C family)